MAKQTRTAVLFLTIGVTLGLAVALVISFLSNEDLFRVYPKNCNEYAIDYLEMGKRHYGLHWERDPHNWQEAIERETEIMNICKEQFEQ